MKWRDWIGSRTIVRFGEVARRVKSKGYARLLVHRMLKQGILKRLAQGCYSVSNDVFSIASNIYYPGYLSFISASYRYGFTEAIPRTVYVAVPKRRKNIAWEGYDIRFIPLKHIWGYHKEGRDSSTSFIADVEKLMIDAFLYPQAMGNFEEIENVFRKVETVDLERMKEYVKRLDSNRIYRQIGYLLEKYQQISLKGLLPIDKNYYNLNPFQKKRAKKINKKWRLFF